MSHAGKLYIQFLLACLVVNFGIFTCQLALFLDLEEDLLLCLCMFYTEYCVTLILSPDWVFLLSRLGIPHDF